MSHKPGDYIVFFPPVWPVGYSKGTEDIADVGNSTLTLVAVSQPAEVHVGKSIGDYLLPLHYPIEVQSPP